MLLDCLHLFPPPQNVLTRKCSKWVFNNPHNFVDKELFYASKKIFGKIRFLITPNFSNHGEGGRVIVTQSNLWCYLATVTVPATTPSAASVWTVDGGDVGWESVIDLLGVWI